MSDDFIARWSRRKRAARTGADAPPHEAAPQEAPAPAPSVPDGPSTSMPSADATQEVAEALPPLEMLGPESDYTAFLKPGVPAELRAAALRRAWVSDQAIAGFRGMGDYDWDFNAPGYGKLLAVDDVAALARAVFSAPLPTAEAATTALEAPEAPLDERRDEAPEAAAPLLTSSEDRAVLSTFQPRPAEETGGASQAQPNELVAPAAGGGADEPSAIAASEMPARRRHGGATPV